jgi:hypothetical protein
MSPEVETETVPLDGPRQPADDRITFVHADREARIRQNVARGKAGEAAA